MTDRIRTLTVTLDKDYRDDDVQVIVDAIKMIKCVNEVEIGEPVTSIDHMARQALKHDVRMKLYKAVNEAFGDKEFE